jgi:hypothetical protein
MSTGGAKLTRKQEQALSALLACGSIRQAAAQAQVSDRSLRTWLKGAAFLAEYRRQRRALLEASLGLLQRASAKAVRVLVRNLSADKPADQIKAAVAILDRSFRGLELLDLEERLAALEREAARRKRDETGRRWWEDWP